jgi:hypothetical protein
MRACLLPAAVLLLAACSGSPSSSQADAGDTCAELAQHYAQVADELNHCTDASECVAYRKDCGIGFPDGGADCFFYLNRAGNQTQFATMKLEWDHLGCRGSCPSCAGPPPLACTNGKCVPAP